MNEEKTKELDEALAWLRGAWFWVAGAVVAIAGFLTAEAMGRNVTAVGFAGLYGLCHAGMVFHDWCGACDGAFKRRN